MDQEKAAERERQAAERAWHDDQFDNCQVCMGLMGGAKGNENRSHFGDTYLVVCDYCSCMIYDMDFEYKDLDELLTLMCKEWHKHLKRVNAALREYSSRFGPLNK